MITLGIDPGWASFGIAAQEDGKVIQVDSFAPRTFGSIYNFVGEISVWMTNILRNPDSIWSIENPIYIERFVTYQGMQTDPEKILMIIGALDFYLSNTYTHPTLVKAIDWKVKLCHHIVQTTGESNPSKSLDKKFSIWAAEKMSGLKLKSDHEADAVCLSYLTEEILNGIHTRHT